MSCGVPDAPWVRDPERYMEEWYGKPLYMDADFEEIDEDADDD